MAAFFELALRHSPGRAGLLAAVTHSELTNLTQLSLGSQISSIESGDFSGLTNLMRLFLGDNQISNIESGSFSREGNGYAP